MLERLLHFFQQYPLDLISHLSSSLPIITGFIRLKEFKKSEKFIHFLFIFYFIKDTYALLSMLLIPNNLYVQNIEQIIVSAFMGLIYFYSFEQASHKKIILFTTIICVLALTFFYKSSDVSTISLSVSRVFSIAVALFYFNKIMTDMRVKSITKHTMFWFTSALLIYSAGTFFIMLFSEYWYQDSTKVLPAKFDLYWNVSQVLFIIFCILSAYSLWVSKYDKENYI